MTGPVAATEMGNLLTQDRACGELASLADQSRSGGRQTAADLQRVSGILPEDRFGNL